MREYANEAELVASLIEHATREYDGFPVGMSGSRLSGGERNDVFLLEGRGERRVLRVAHHTTPPAGLRYTNDWIRFAAGSLKEVPAPFLTRSGDTLFAHEGQLVTLFPFVEGEYGDCRKEAHRVAMARVQAKLHQVGLRYPVRQCPPGRVDILELDFDENFLWKWRDVVAMFADGGRCMFESPGHDNERDQECIRGIYDHRETLLAARRELDEWVRSTRARKARMQYALIHGDLYAANVLMQGDEISGIIDWDECGFESLAYELGRNLYAYCKDPARLTLDLPASRRYLEVYEQSGGPARSDEWDLLVPFARLLRFCDTVFYMNNTIIGDVWSPAYGWESVQALENMRGLSLF